MAKLLSPLDAFRQVVVLGALLLCSAIVRAGAVMIRPAVLDVKPDKAKGPGGGVPSPSRASDLTTYSQPSGRPLRRPLALRGEESNLRSLSATPCECCPCPQAYHGVSGPDGPRRDRAGLDTISIPRSPMSRHRSRPVW